MLIKLKFLISKCRQDSTVFRIFLFLTYRVAPDSSTARLTEGMPGNMTKAETFGRSCGLPQFCTAAEHVCFKKSTGSKMGTKTI